MQLNVDQTSQIMASRKEMERLEDENRTVCQRLSDVEVELNRKEEALKAANQKYVSFAINCFKHSVYDSISPCWLNSTSF